MCQSKAMLPYIIITLQRHSVFKKVIFNYLFLNLLSCRSGYLDQNIPCHTEVSMIINIWKTLIGDYNSFSGFSECMSKKIRRMAQNGRILAPQAVCRKTVEKQCSRCRRYSNVVRLSSLKGESSNTGRKNIFTNNFLIRRKPSANSRPYFLLLLLLLLTTQFFPFSLPFAFPKSFFFPFLCHLHSPRFPFFPLFKPIFDLWIKLTY